jgi:hypothetical protein
MKPAIKPASTPVINRRRGAKGDLPFIYSLQKGLPSSVNCDKSLLFQALVGAISLLQGKVLLALC